jgi:two-component system sensor histidine kinase KdpD
VAALNSPKRRLVAATLAWLAALTVGILALHPYRDSLESGTVALILLVAPLLASLAGLTVAFIASLISAMAFNYFFTTPYYSFRIDSDTSIAAFLTYAIMSMLTAGMLNRLITQREHSDARAREAVLLRDLTLDLASQSTWLEPPVRSALADLHRALALDGVFAIVAAEHAVKIGIGNTEQLEPPATEMVSTSMAGHGVRSLRPDPSITLLPIRAGDESFGVLAIARKHPITDAERRVLDAFINVLALAAQRARLIDDAVERRTLEETDRLRVALLQSVTHDLRTPLTAIKALAGAMLQTSGLGADHQDMLRDIESESDRLANLVNGLLDLSRIESGGLKLHRTSIDIEELVHAVVATPALSHHETQFTIEVDPQLPSIDADETLLRQALFNILDNAVRHGAPPIEIEATVRHGRLLIVVRDHGPGISPPERERLFIADPRRRPGRSMGVGLQVTRGFIDAHGGSIRVDPTPGGGATFTIALPVTPDGGSTPR